MKKPKSNRVVAYLIAVSVGFPVLLYILVLGPVYSLVGDTTKTAEEQDKILHRAETISHALQLAASIAVFVVAVYFVKELTKYAQNRKNKTK